MTNEGETNAKPMQNHWYSCYLIIRLIDSEIKNIWQHDDRDAACAAGNLTEIVMPVWNWLLVMISKQNVDNDNDNGEWDGNDKTHPS